MPETAPPMEPVQVRLPLIKFYFLGNKVVGEVVGSTSVPPGMMNGRYLGPNGYTTDPNEATDFRGEPGMTIVEGETVEVVGPRGDPGANGKSALQLWQEAGNQGGVAEFLTSLKGQQGDQGTPGLKGNDGAPAADGAPGQNGTNGTNGTDGAPGKSAYQVWLQEGHQGDPSYFLASLAGVRGEPGLKGDKGDKGDNGTPGNPGAPGADGKDVEMQKVSAGLQWRLAGGNWSTLITLAEMTGPAGANATNAQVASAVADWLVANAASVKGAKGDKGDTGSPGAAGAPANTLVGNVSLGQTAAIALALGIREVTVTLAGTTVGTKYQAFCTGYRLNGAATTTPGRPAGYAIVDCVCNVAGQITVSVNAPLLAIGASYALFCDIVKVNAA